MEAKKYEGKIVSATHFHNTSGDADRLVFLYVFKNKLYPYWIEIGKKEFDTVILTDGPSKLVWRIEANGNKSEATVEEIHINPDIFSKGVSVLDPESFKNLKNKDLVSLKRKIEEEIERRRDELNDTMLDIGFPDSSGSEV